MKQNISSGEDTSSDTEQLKAIVVCIRCEGRGEVVTAGSDTLQECPNCVGTGLCEAVEIDYPQRFRELAEAAGQVLSHLELHTLDRGEYLVLRLNGQVHYARRDDMPTSAFLSDLDRLFQVLRGQS